MIDIWAFLENEPPMLRPQVGETVTLSCHWIGLPAGRPKELGTVLPSPIFTPIETGYVVTSAESFGFKAVIVDRFADSTSDHVIGAALQDRYIDLFSAFTPEFEGVVTEVQNIWHKDADGTNAPQQLLKPPGGARPDGYWFDVQVIRVSVE